MVALHKSKKQKKSSHKLDVYGDAVRGSHFQKKIDELKSKMNTKYFPHIAGSLVLASAGTLGLLHKWEPAKGKPDAHLVAFLSAILNSYTHTHGLAAQEASP